MKKSLMICLSAFLMPVSVAIAGNNVKVAIDKSGVFSLSYPQLKEMGFSDPSKVGVIGRGGKALSAGEYSETGAKFTTVPVIHENSTLFFFANGPENMSFQSLETSGAGGRYINQGSNPNSRYGYYILTDEPNTLLTISEAEESEASSSTIDWGVSYIIHELNLEQNITASGNLIWGERFNNGEPSRREWMVNLPGAVNSSDGFFEFSFYTPKGELGTFEFGNVNNGTPNVLSNLKTTSSNFTPLAATNGDVKVMKGDNTFYLQYSADNRHEYANLDYWVLSYKNDMSGAAVSNTGVVSFPQLSKGETALLKFSNLENLIAIDVTDPNNPKLLRKEGNQGFKVTYANEIPSVVVFNATTPQNNLMSWEVTGNLLDGSSLHDMGAAGADMLIISTERFLPYAKELARIHENYDGIKVAIAETEAIYNEFSEGLPDPEAYRRFISLFNQSGKNLENILLMGSIRSNTHNAEEKLGVNNFHISPQGPAISTERGAYPLIDYYGIKTPAPNISRLERENLEIGVGVLPFATEHEAAMYLAKLEDFMTSDRHAYTLNDWLFLGGPGDDHTHDQQCVDLAAYASSLTGKGVISSVLARDAYPYNQDHKKLMEDLDSGKGLLVYIGHSGPALFDKNDPSFFTASDVAGLRNNFLPLMFTGACHTSNTDTGLRGIAEEFVLGSQRGGIGAILTIREVWSSQNVELANYFMECATSAKDEGMSLGKLVADAKNKQSSSNKLCYLLVGDPALRIPFPTTGVDVNPVSSIVPGEMITIEGTVKATNGNVDKNFNGSAVIKLCEPERNIVSEDFISGKNPDNPLIINYHDNVRAMAETEVKDGKFSTTLYVPASMSKFEGENSVIHVACVDPNTVLGKTGSITASIAPVSKTPVADNTAPQIHSIRYDSSSDRIIVEASDNEALSFANTNSSLGRRIRIDGQSDLSTNLSVLSIGEGGRSAEFFASVANILPGDHRVAVEISDAEGNVATKEDLINTGEQFASLSLELQEKGVDDKATFIVAGANNDVSIEIYSSDKRHIASLDASSGSAVWNRRDSSGNFVNGGIYRAVAIEKTPVDGVRHFSKEVIIPVVNQ